MLWFAEIPAYQSACKSFSYFSKRGPPAVGGSLFSFSYGSGEVVYLRIISSEPIFEYIFTFVNTFSTLFSEKYFLSFVIPPFHLCSVIILIISGLCVVELWVEYGWNYEKFHPYSTHNSTLSNVLIIKHMNCGRWKGGTSFA